jgi:hypothetical protein
MARSPSFFLDIMTPYARGSHLSHISWRGFWTPARASSARFKQLARQYAQVQAMHVFHAPRRESVDQNEERAFK